MPYGEKDYQALRKTLAGVKGRFLLTLNDVPEIRALFKGFTMEKVSLKYSCGTGADSRAADRHELFIHNLA